MTASLVDGPVGVLAALPGELGPFRRSRGPVSSRLGLELTHTSVAGRDVIATAAGVGKVAAAHGAATLIAEGAQVLLVVGTAGGLRRNLGPGTLVHCRTAFQVDLAVRETRQVEAHPELLEAWSSVAPGVRGWFLTADRPVGTPWRRARLARAFPGPCVAEMETAAAAVVAQRTGVPWAALRAVTDRASLGFRSGFRKNYPGQAPRAADAILALLGVLNSAHPNPPPAP